MLKANLSDRIVVLTCSEKVSTNIVEKLGPLAGQCHLLPTIKIGIKTESSRLQKMIRSIEAGDFDWVVASSAYSAESLSLNGFNKDLVSTDLAVVGPKTAAAFVGIGWPTAFVPTEYSAAEFIKQFPEPVRRASKVLVIQGNLATEEIKVGLEAKGYITDQVVAYETSAHRYSQQALEKNLKVLSKSEIICFTSPSTVENFVNQFGSDSVPKSVISIGPATSESLKSFGINIFSQAAVSSDQGIVDVIHHLLRS